MSAIQGKFVWYELVTSDAPAAAEFYRQVIGWNIQDSGAKEHLYLLLSAGSDMIGGMMTLPKEACNKGARPGWMGYVGVADVDDFTARVRNAGGQILRAPDDIAGVGRFAVAADPHGAAFVLFTPKAGPEAAAGTPCTTGHVGWRELQAGNLNEAWDFYAGVFGWSKTMAVDMGPMGTYQTFATGGDAVGGMMTKVPEAPHPFWLYYFAVDAIEAAMTRVKHSGGQVLFGPQEVPGGAWIAQCLDPQGALFAMLAPKR